MKNEQKLETESTETAVETATSKATATISSESAAAEVGIDDKTPTIKRRLTKKQMVFLIIAIALSVIIIISSLTVKFVMFNDLKYEIPGQDNGIISLKANNAPVFSDDFTSFNEKVWAKEAYVRRGGVWSTDQVFVENDNLIIRTEKKDGKWVTGAVTSTAEQGDYRTYGYYEVRCMLPAGSGIWSAFWLMPQGGNDFGAATSKDAKIWGAEIDIFEGPMWPAQKVQQAVHNGGYGKHNSSSTNPRWLFKEYKNLYTEYHTYGLYWDENVYKFYVDDICVWTTNCGNNISTVNEFMYLSVEIGGKNGEPVSNPWIGGKKITKNKEGDSFRSDFKIDYVKIWDIGAK